MADDSRCDKPCQAVAPQGTAPLPIGENAPADSENQQQQQQQQ